LNGRGMEIANPLPTLRSRRDQRSQDKPGAVRKLGPWMTWTNRSNEIQAGKSQDVVLIT
jgi:hypothetical protein